MSDRKTYYDSKHETVKRRKLSADLNDGKRYSIVSVSKLVRRCQGRERLATISCTGNNFSYYDPATALAKTLQSELAEPAPSAVRSVDPSTVECTPLGEIGITKLGEAGGAYFHKRAWTRMRRIAGRYIRCWCSKHDRFGMFFLFPEKVIFQTWSFRSGWSSCRVPEEGLDIDGDRR